VTEPTPTGGPTDTRRVIRLPHGTRLLAAWLICAAVALVVVWFTPLNVWFTPLVLEHGSSVACWVDKVSTPGPCPWNPAATPNAAGYVCPAGDAFNECYDPKTGILEPSWLKGLNGPKATQVSTPAKRADRPILILRAAALGTVFWVAFLGVRAVLSRVRFTVA
jgi:hypothetical protein